MFLDLKSYENIQYVKLVSFGSPVLIVLMYEDKNLKVKMNKIKREEILNVIYIFGLHAPQKPSQFYLNLVQKIFSLSHSKLDFLIQNL